MLLSFFSSQFLFIFPFINRFNISSFFVFLYSFVFSSLLKSVALVVKYSDNIFKGFATSISVALSCIIGSYLFDDVKLNDTFCRGSLVVFLSSSAYVLVTNHRNHQNPNTRNGNLIGSDPNGYHNMQLLSTLTAENISQISPFTV